MYKYKKKKSLMNFLKKLKVIDSHLKHVLNSYFI